MNVSYWTLNGFKWELYWEEKAVWCVFFFFFLPFQRENLTLLCSTLLTNPWLLFAPTVTVMKKAVTIGTIPIQNEKSRSNYIDVLYSDEKNRDKYFCSVYRAMNQSHILMDKSLLLHELVKTVNWIFFSFYCLSSIIFMERFLFFFFFIVLTSFD